MAKKRIGRIVIVAWPRKYEPLQAKPGAWLAVRWDRSVVEQETEHVRLFTAHPAKPAGD